jgi:outer membrane protein assembly factor BamB
MKHREEGGQGADGGAPLVARFDRGMAVARRCLPGSACPQRPFSRLLAVAVMIVSLGAGASAQLAPGAATEGEASSVFQGGPTHAGFYPGRPGAHLAGIQWRFATAGSVTSSPVVVKGVVYVGSGDGHVYALDLETGGERWAATATGAVDAAPAVAAGRVFVGDRAGVFHALDAATGKELWSFREGMPVPFPWGHESGDIYRSSATIAGGMVLFGGTDGFVYALDPATGRPKWRTDLQARIPGSPAVAEGLVVVGDAAGIVHALDLASGASRWTFRTAGSDLVSADFGFDRRTIQSSPSIAGDRVFVGARDGFLYALDLHTGKRLWQFDHEVSWVNTTPAVAAGVVYAGSSDAHFVQAVDAATGRELWRADTENIEWSSPAVAGGSVFAGDGAGWMYAFDRANGSLQWRYRTGDRVMSSPTVAGDLVVFGSDDGGVYALRTTAATTRRVVYWSDALAKGVSYRGAQDIVAYLRDSGYEEMDEKGIAEVMRSGMRDGVTSVIVFALDYLPPALLAPEGGKPLLRAYLEAGGKVVWPGIPPLLWPRDPSTGQAGGLDHMQWEAPTKLLGVDHRATMFDPRTVRVTEEGVRWGLEGRWRARWSVDRSAPTRVLGLDGWGYAAAWVQEYGHGPGTGFIMASGLPASMIYRLAEARPSR